MLAESRRGAGAAKQGGKDRNAPKGSVCNPKIECQDPSSKIVHGKKSKRSEDEAEAATEAFEWLQAIGSNHEHKDSLYQSCVSENGAHKCWKCSLVETTSGASTFTGFVCSKDTRGVSDINGNPLSTKPASTTRAFCKALVTRQDPLEIKQNRRKGKRGFDSKRKSDRKLARKIPSFIKSYCVPTTRSIMLARNPIFKQITCRATPCDNAKAKLERLLKADKAPAAGTLSVAKADVKKKCPTPCDTAKAKVAKLEADKAPAGTLSVAEEDAAKKCSASKAEKARRGAQCDVYSTKFFNKKYTPFNGENDGGFRSDLLLQF